MYGLRQELHIRSMFLPGTRAVRSRATVRTPSFLIPDLEVPEHGPLIRETRFNSCGLQLVSINLEAAALDSFTPDQTAATMQPRRNRRLKSWLPPMPG